MPNLPAPTGEEQPRKYYGGAYLDEIDSIKHEIKSAVPEGRDINVSEAHPLDVIAAAPNLTNTKDKEALLRTLPNPKDVGLEVKSMQEAHGDKDDNKERAKHLATDRTELAENAGADNRGSEDATKDEKEVNSDPSNTDVKNDEGNNDEHSNDRSSDRTGSSSDSVSGTSSLSGFGTPTDVDSNDTK